MTDSSVLTQYHEDRTTPYKHRGLGCYIIGEVMDRER